MQFHVAFKTLSLPTILERAIATKQEYLHEFFQFELFMYDILDGLTTDVFNTAIQTALATNNQADRVLIRNELFNSMMDICGLEPMNSEKAKSKCLSGGPVVHPLLLPLLFKVISMEPVDVFAMESLMLLTRKPECEKFTMFNSWPKLFLPFLNNGHWPHQFAINRSTLLAAHQGPTVIELALQCRKLVKMDLLTLSDPVVEVYHSTHNGAAAGGFKLIGTTEVIDNDHNPNFLTRFKISVDATQFPRQQLKFIVYDADGAKLRKEDRMGY